MHRIDRVSIQRLRRQLPLPVFVLILVLLVVVLGFFCLCINDHPTQAAERAISAMAHAPALVDMWALTILVLAPLLLTAAKPAVPAIGRASPAHLQRFRF